MKKIVLISLMVSTILLSAEIVGGFGLALGDTFDTTKATSTSKTTSGEILYGVAPPKKLKYFKNYYVLITPKTKKIKQIWGMSNYENTATCNKDLEVIAILLENKYGKLEKKISMDQTRAITIGENRVSIKCSGFMKPDMYLQYTSYKLIELSKREAAELEAEKIDTSAL
ncbi:hypothetical protein ACLHDG_06620 [Sulfurovum sp. CS9]|uniref:hypothetical protein n=1 Tax=Sulfurovum sp. CS9 TaxID=3391146 RepID=UPI0039EA2DDB